MTTHSEIAYTNNFNCFSVIVLSLLFIISITI